MHNSVDVFLSSDKICRMTQKSDYSRLICSAQVETSQFFGDRVSRFLWDAVAELRLVNCM